MRLITHIEIALAIAVLTAVIAHRGGRFQWMYLVTAACVGYLAANVVGWINAVPPR
jgi:hypothetical protein